MGGAKVPSSAKTLRASPSMTKAELIEEVRKGQRWLQAAVKREAKAVLTLRRREAEQKNQGQALMREKEVSELLEKIDFLEQALEAHRALESGSNKLARVVFIPSPVNRNDHEEFRLTIDLILNANDVWVDRIPGTGFGAYFSQPQEIYPLVLQNDQIRYGSDGADPLLKLRGKPIRVGEVYPFFSDGESRTDSRESYRCARIVPLLHGHLGLAG